MKVSGPPSGGALCRAYTIVAMTFSAPEGKHDLISKDIRHETILGSAIGGHTLAPLLTGGFAAPAFAV